MVTTVGQDVISAKRDLREIFPKEFANRLLINEFITYVLNNFFEKSNEKIVSAYAGEVVPSVDGTECYIREPSVERQMNQIIPVVNDGSEYITYANFIADLHNEGCTVFDENKLLATKYWSWCPPINVDMFINTYNYYWIGWDSGEKDMKILTGPIDVSQLIGTGNPVYNEYTPDGAIILESQYEFKNGDRVVFTNDLSNKYNNVPYIVGGLTYNPDGTNDGKGYFKLTAVKMPLIVLDGATNIGIDAEGQASYTYIDEAHELSFEFQNGMRIMFLNDSNTNYNNIPFMVTGVGSSIKMIDDSYDPYSSLYEDDYDLYVKLVSKPDYFVMERGCADGNDWSARNRWVHVSALEVFNIDSISTSDDYRGLYHASKPILCYTKDIKLYNYGTFDRGYVVAITSKQVNEINNKFKSSVLTALNLTQLNTGDKILFKNVEGANPIQIYTVTIVTSKTGTELVTLKACTNGQEIDGKTSTGGTVKGDVVKKINGIYNIPYYYDGLSWVEGQRKDAPNHSNPDYNGINQNPLFDLFDSDKVKLDNSVTYPNSTFKGCKLFDYKEATAEDGVYSGDEYDEKGNVVVYGLDRYILNEDEDKNYIFDNLLHTQVFKYTPPMDYEQEIKGYKFFTINFKDEYLNDWHLSSSKYNQYIKTQFEANDEPSFVEIDEEQYYKFTIKYLPSSETTKKALVVSINGEKVEAENVIQDNYDIYVKGVKYNDTIIVNILTDEDIEELDPNYTFEPPLSLVINQFNDEIETIGYNNCFDQMIDIMENQVGFVGRANGSNNYSSLNPDLSVGSKIIQSASNIIRTMILDNDTNTTVRSSIEYVENAYTRFKNKFSTVLDQYYIKGEIVDDMRTTYETNEEMMDEIITRIINSINVGKDGLMPFYNNGVTHLLDNAYIPATPAYLGIANCYEPKIKVYDEYLGEVKPKVIVGHDGSLTKAYNNVKDLFILRLEKLIYASINTKFKDTRCGINKYEFLPGFFRKQTYTRDELINTYSTFVDLWANNAGVDYSENIHFDYDLTANPEAWKTWNYSNTFTPDGDELHGSYKAVYTYYYDTYRPDSHPWEMLGFGDQPSWWETEYGAAPYTASNIIMWQDIENGIIKDGDYAGEYEELKRPGLVEKYLPVDNNGKLKSPMDIGIIEEQPSIQRARARWKIGDFGDVEIAYMQTSAFKFAEQLVLYLLRPISWVENNWNTLDTAVLFKGTDYEQTINARTEARENISETVMHNELVDDEYVRNIGIQQWISDYALSNNLSITSIADKIRKATVNLGYRCAGFYQKDTVAISTDTYGEIPNENVHMSLFKSKNNKTLTYSAMAIIKTKKGYMIDGFDKSFPYFMVRVPEINGKKGSYSTSGSSNVTSSTSYIVDGSKEFSSVWLSATRGGDAFNPSENKVYKIASEGKYKNKLYTWNGNSYTEMTSINRNDGLTVYYPLEWKDEIQKVPYKKEFTSIQELYTVINGYGKYLEENENWYFNTRNSSGVVMNWRISSESFVNWATSQKGQDTEGNLLLLNPGVIGLGNYNTGIVEDLNLKNCGYNSVLDIHGNPISADKLNVFRQTFNTFIQPKEDNIALVKLRTYQLEHLLVLDNVTIYGDILYDSKYFTILGRFKLHGVKARNWYGTIYAPGYLVEDDGAIANFDKSANDLQYMFDVDDARCQGEKAEYSRAIVGYGKTKTYVNLFRNDKAMFDFYKGAIRQKGTRTVIDKMNRSSYVSSTGNNIEIFENWLFKAGEFGHTRDNSVLEFLLDMEKMRENPQVITFEMSSNYYYDEKQVYNVGNVVIYHNYEYSCLNNEVTGKFNPNDWQLLRYVGNYIIFGDDKKWIKKQRNPQGACFSYTDSLLINPVGGFAQLNDVEYIVANEEEFEQIKDEMAVEMTVWIAKLENGDWDIRKKTGVNKFVSMRYPTLEDAYRQPAYENVYHFTDDKKDYYTTETSATIDSNPLTPLYSDIDLNDYTCKWCDIGSPMYTGEKGQYVTGTDYKVKMYNTVFKTMVPESEVNNSTTLRDLGNDASITYSNLLLNMTQFGKQFYKYKWKMIFNIVTHCPDIIVTINGQEYKDQDKIKVIVCEGDTIHWKATAFGCGTKEDTFYVPYTPKMDEEDVPEETEFPTTDLYDSRCIKMLEHDDDTNQDVYIFYSYKSGFGWVRMGTSIISRQLNITVPLSFRDKTVFMDQTTPETREILFCDEGNYEVKLVGAGGGSGGGYTSATKVKKKHHGFGSKISGVFKKVVQVAVTVVAVAASYVTYGLSTALLAGALSYKGSAKVLASKKWVIVHYGGCPGASGAYVDALVKVDDSQITSPTNKYYITCGAGGKGGAYNCDGDCGIDSTLYNNDILLIKAQAGNGGAAALRKGDRIRNGRLMGLAGMYTINTSWETIETKTAVCGNCGGLGSYQGYYGKSVYPGSNYGQGGDFVQGGAGHSGYNGYTKVVYHAGEHYDDYSILSTSEDSLPVAIELGESDSMEYTAYFQPFVLPPTVNGVTYFYSYDVLYDDETRPNADILGPGTQFYKNRSKSITGYHKTNVIKNLWAPNKLYKAGDTVTDSDENCKYYICVVDHLAGGLFSTTQVIDGEVVTVWEEYAPTYYYKINCNFDAYNPSTHQKLDNKKPNFVFNGIKYNTELYLDAECTERATKDSVSTNIEDRVMTVDDLIYPGYTVGNVYTLVDPFATYSQLTPRYITEPTWGDINQVGSYDVNSGLIEYYAKLDKKTTEEDKESLVYADKTCQSPVISIDIDLEDETTLVYNQVNMKYTDLTEVVSDHHETSYEMKDNDLYLYTSKTVTEIQDDTPVYSEFELLNVIGVYGDYVPHWEKLVYTPNAYSNTVNYIDYDITEATIDKGVKNYTVTLYADDQLTKEIDLFYKEKVDVTQTGEEKYQYKHFYTPIRCAATSNPVVGTVPYSIPLFYINKPENVVDKESDLPPYSQNVGLTFKVLENESGIPLDSPLYYKATDAGWSAPKTLTEILNENKNSSFTEYEENDDPLPIYVKLIGNTSIMYAEENYNEDVINQNTSLLVNNVNNSIKMFFNRQGVGAYINSNGLIVDTEDKEELSIMFDNETAADTDPIVDILSTIDNAIGPITDIDKKIKKIKEIVADNVTNDFFIDVNEVLTLYKNNNYNSLEDISTSLKYSDTLTHTHSCRIFDSYRNIGGEEKVYDKLYQYGDKFYYGRYVITDESVNSSYVGIEAGTVESLTTYNKIQDTPTDIEEDKIVNVITYKDFGDYLYITHDSYKDRNNVDPNALCDVYNVSKIDGTYGLESNPDLVNKKGWMKIEYIDKDFMFNLAAAQRLRINSEIIKSCYLVDNYDDSTIVKVQVFDPIQNIIPNNVLDEVNYISSSDPVNDYTDVGKWNNNKIGYLWWDTSKVRYVDYYQGDYEYRRTTWGKQLPGSEIVVNEWVRRTERPTEDIPYVTRTLYDNELGSDVTYYYYWEKNPVEIPGVSFRKNSALTIASIINNPTEEGIVWMSPIDSNINGKGENTMIISNYNNVITGQEAVLQLNLDSDKDVLDHTEWVQVKENTNADIPEFLWEKMTDSLLGYKEIEGINAPVPSADLSGRQRLGISYRPRQTMFDKLYNARENFVKIINDIFAGRNYEQINNDMSGWLLKYNPKYPVVDEPKEGTYYDEADTKLEMMSWRDEGLIDQNVLVKNDETLDGIWAIYRVNDNWTYTLVDYQKFNINNYLSLIDWYDNDEVKYLTPTWIVTSSSNDAITLCKTLEEGKMVKYTDGTNWELYQLINNEGILEVKLVGKSNTLIKISDSLYDYVNEGIDDTEPYIVLEDGTTLTKLDYKADETLYLIKMLLEYFNV